MHSKHKASLVHYARSTLYNGKKQLNEKRSQKEMAKERKKRLRVKTLMALHIGEESKPRPFSYTECLLDTHGVSWEIFIKNQCRSSCSVKPLAMGFTRIGPALSSASHRSLFQ